MAPAKANHCPRLENIRISYFFMYLMGPFYAGPKSASFFQVALIKGHFKKQKYQTLKIFN